MFLSTFLIWMIAGMVALLVGLLLYANALLRENVSLAYNISRGAALTVTHSTQRSMAVGMMESVWRRYSSLSEEEQALIGTPEYDLLFADIQDTREHRELRDLLRFMCDSYDVYDLYMAIIDGERETFVYVADPDEEEMQAGY